MQTVVGIFTSQRWLSRPLSSYAAWASHEIRSIFWFLAPHSTGLSRCPRAIRNNQAWGCSAWRCRWGPLGGRWYDDRDSAQCPGARHWHRHGYRPCGSESPGPGGGAVAGAVAGGALEDTLANGLPKDEFYVYKDALRRGRTVLMALVEDADQATAARAALAQAGAESGCSACAMVDWHA